MSLNKLKMVTSVLAGAAILSGLVLCWSGWTNAEQARAQAETKQGGLLPFTLVVGKHYQILLPNHQQWPGEHSLVRIQKNFANGWVEVQTEENQTAWINLNQAMQLYLIADPQKYHRETARQP